MNIYFSKRKLPPNPLFSTNNNLYDNKRKKKAIKN